MSGVSPDIEVPLSGEGREGVRLFAHVHTGRRPKCAGVRCLYAFLWCPRR